MNGMAQVIDCFFEHRIDPIVAKRRPRLAECPKHPKLPSRARQQHGFEDDAPVVDDDSTEAGEPVHAVGRNAPGQTSGLCVDDACCSCSVFENLSYIAEW